MSDLQLQGDGEPMETSTYVALSQATALRNELDVTTNNIANANTAGFKGERVAFESYLQREGIGTERRETAFLTDSGSYLDTRQGAVSDTGNPLDVALQGEGWFAYRTTDGQTAYGRDGRFNIDQQGNLVTLNGAQVLDVGGAPIALPPDVGAAVSISRDGTISSPANGPMAKLGVVTLPDLQAYERIGGGLLVPPQGVPTQAPIPDTATELVQGAIEGSNVQPVVEMTRLMSIQKAYDRAVQLMSSEDDLRRDMLRRIGRPT